MKLEMSSTFGQALASIGMPIDEGMTVSMDHDECPHGLVYDIASVESDTGYSSTKCSDEDDVQTAEIKNDETEHGYSIVDEKDVRIAGANKKAKF